MVTVVSVFKKGKLLLLLSSSVVIVVVVVAVAVSKVKSNSIPVTGS
jgi:hypothetical protein